MSVSICSVCKVWVAKNLTKHSSVLLLHSVRFSMTQMLCTEKFQALTHLILKHMLAFSDCPWMGNLRYCDLFGKSWFLYYTHMLVFLTLRYAKRLIQNSGVPSLSTLCITYWPDWICYITFWHDDTYVWSDLLPSLCYITYLYERRVHKFLIIGACEKMSFEKLAIYFVTLAFISHN